MQRKKYFQWIIIAVTAILAVGLIFILTLKNRKSQKQHPDIVSPTPSASPAINASDLPTSVPSPTATASPTGSSADHKAAARAAYASKNYLLAMSQYTLAITTATSDTDRAQLWNELGNTYRDNQSTAEALAAYDKAIALNYQLGDAYLNKAGLQWTLKQKEAARSTLLTGINAEATRKSELENTLSVYDIEE